MPKNKSSSSKFILKPAHRKWFFIALGIFILGLLVNALLSIFSTEAPVEVLVPLEKLVGSYHCEEASEPSPIPAGTFFNVQAEGGKLVVRWNGHSWTLFREEDGDFRVQGSNVEVTFAQYRDGDIFGLSAREGSNVFLKASKPRLLPQIPRASR